MSRCSRIRRFTRRARWRSIRTARRRGCSRMIATPSLFHLIKATPQIGRTFSDAEGEIGNERRVILSYALWQSAFGGDRQVVGKDARINSQPYTIVGVMPRGFLFMEPDVMLWIPAAFTPAQKSDEERHSNNWRNVGRLKPGATLQQAQSQVDALNAANMERFPQYKQLLINAGFRTGRHTVAGLSGSRRPSDSVLDVGRRLVRVVDWRRERREPRIGAFASAHQRTGDSPCARRRPRPRRASTGGRKRAADDGVGGDWTVSRLRGAAFSHHPQSARPAPRRRDSARRYRRGVYARHCRGHRPDARPDSGCDGPAGKLDVGAARRGPDRHQRSRRPDAASQPGGCAGGVRVRAVDRRWSVVCELPPHSFSRSRFSTPRAC